jgi:hypothetical protein
MRDCFVHSGSSAQVMEKTVEPNLCFIEGRARQHPYCEQFINACACDIIRAFRPNLLMIHPANVDAYRHRTGLFYPLVTHGLHEIDNWLGDIITQRWTRALMTGRISSSPATTDSWALCAPCRPMSCWRKTG